MFINELDNSLKSRVIRLFYYMYLDTICRLYFSFFAKVDNRKLKYYLSFCLIFKDEAPFLKEWLDYHLTIGVDHFYLYNNNSSDEYMTVLEPYIKRGLVSLVDWPFEQSQAQAYENCIDKYKNESNWIAFIDADEFVCPKFDTDLKNWLSNYSKYPGVCVKWLHFGSGGSLKHDYSKYVIEQYHSCWEKFHFLGKCFVNTRYKVVNWDTPAHDFHHKTQLKMKMWGFNHVVPSVTQYKHFNHKFDSLNRTHSSIQINHYYSKAWDVASERMKRSDVFYKNIKRTSDNFWIKEFKCVSFDYTITRFLQKLKQKGL